jgi:DMSO/TMAO reductase YedYZ heme-binding membrane subunit
MKLPDRRFIAWAAGLALMAGLPLRAGFTRPGWELAEVLGLVGALACIVLFGWPVRPRDATPPLALSLARHEFLGWIALGAGLLHVIIALAVDHTVVNYLKITSPPYQLAGIAALVLLLALVLSSLAGPRRRLWRSHRTFQATHVGLGCLLAALLGAHVIATDRYTGGYGRRLLFIAVAAGALAMLLRRRRGTATAPASASASASALAPAPAPALAPAPRFAPHRFVFGRHSRLVASLVAAAILALGMLIPGRAGVALREPIVHRAAPLSLNFDHGKHTAVNCLVCHHNYADGRGFDSCIHCHRSGRTDLTVGVEARFHVFCLNCHRNPEPRFPRHGPVSGCAACHQVPAPAT